MNTFRDHNPDSQDEFIMAKAEC